jgi:hypothetical protein
MTAGRVAAVTGGASGFGLGICRGITANTIPPFCVDTPMRREAQATENISGAVL